MIYTEPPMPTPRPKLPQGWLLVRGLAVLACLAMQGCAFYGDKAADPSERGMAYIASAIIVAAILRALFNR